MTSIIYARVSSDRQQEDGTVQSQLDAIHNHPTVKGSEIAEAYVDDGVSGYSKALWDRPEGSRLLADAEAGKWRGADLLVTRLNRLGRRAREIEEAIDRLLDAGVTVYSVKEGYRFDNQTSMGRFTRQLFASLAELDRNVIVETTRDGMVRKARQGALMPTYAYLGYRWSEVDDRGHKKPGARLLVDEVEASLARLIFEKYPSLTNGGLAKWLNANGYRLPCKSPARRERHGRSDRLFDSKAITDIISNDLYTGTLSWGKTTKVEGQNPEEFRHHVPELQIVSFEAFARAQEARADRRRGPSKSQGSPYTYSGLLRCPECGGTTVGKRQWHKSYGYRETRRYVCRRNHVHGAVACKGWAAFEQTVDKAVMPFLADLLENRLGIRDHLHQAAMEMESASVGDRAQRFHAEIDSARHELAKVQEGYLAEVFTADEARNKSLELRERIERAQRSLEGLSSAADLKADLAGALKLLEKPVAEFLYSLPSGQLARVCRAVFEGMTIRASGHGRQRQAEIVAYQLTPALKVALTDRVHIESNRPALDVV